MVFAPKVVKLDHIPEYSESSANLLKADIWYPSLSHT